MKTKIYLFLGIAAAVAIGVIIYKKTKDRKQIATKELIQTKEKMV
jgi:hypothetical protein